MAAPRRDFLRRIFLIAAKARLKAQQLFKSKALCIVVDSAPLAYKRRGTRVASPHIARALRQEGDTQLPRQRRRRSASTKLVPRIMSAAVQAARGPEPASPPPTEIC